MAATYTGILPCAVCANLKGTEIIFYTLAGRRTESQQTVLAKLPQSAAAVTCWGVTSVRCQTGRVAGGPDGLSAFPRRACPQGAHLGAAAQDKAAESEFAFPSRIPSACS